MFLFLILGFLEQVAEKVKSLDHVNSPVKRGTNRRESIVDSYKRRHGYEAATTQELKDSIKKISGKSNPGFFSDYSQPRARPPSHN